MRITGGIILALAVQHVKLTTVFMQGAKPAAEASMLASPGDKEPRVSEARRFSVYPAMTRPAKEEQDSLETSTTGEENPNDVASPHFLADV